MSPPLIQAQQLVKRFGALLANDHVDLTVAAGEVHALLGENGAGKSTLVKMLYGLLQPDAGRILWRGEAVALPGPRDARARGIGMVFQHFSLFEALTVAENVALALDGAEPLARIADRLADVSRAYGLPLEPHREVWQLSVGERQRIEIVRCLLQDPKLLILDNWGDYYAERAQAVIAGTWRPTDTWGGLGSGMFRMAPWTNMTPEEVSEAERVRDALAAGSLQPFAGPILRQDGTSVIAQGQRLTDEQIRAQNYFYQGIEATIPG